MRPDSVIGRTVSAAVAVVAMLVGGVAAAATPPADPPAEEAPPESVEIDGATVAVGLPPVPPTTVEVAVGLPPVPPTTAPVRVAEAAPVVELDPDLVAQLTSLVIDAATSAALALRR